jgi:hypothetical protein
MPSPSRAQHVMPSSMPSNMGPSSWKWCAYDLWSARPGIMPLARRTVCSFVFLILLNLEYPALATLAPWFGCQVLFLCHSLFQIKLHPQDTYRYHGHSISDPGSTYRTREEVQGIRRARDPIEHVRTLLIKHGLEGPAELKALENSVKKVPFLLPWHASDGAPVSAVL